MENFLVAVELFGIIILSKINIDERMRVIRMRKVAMILVLALFFSSLGLVHGEEEKVYAAAKLGNVEVTANNLNIRQEKSTDSKILCMTSKKKIYKVLAEGKDSQGRIWYKVNAEFGVSGWIAGWYCKKTKEGVNTTYESKYRELLYPCTNKDIYIKLLLLENYSIKNVVKICGSKYTVKDGWASKTYEYKNGIYFDVDSMNEVYYINVNGRVINVKDVRKVKGDILSDKGNEILITNGNYLYVIAEESKQLLKEYETGFSDISEIKVGDFAGDNNLELYLSGSDDYILKQNIYKVSKDKFTRIYDITSFDSYSKGIKTNISKNTLKLDINIGSHSVKETSKLPDRIFYNTKETKDKNKLVSVDTSWNLIEENGKWYIKVRNTVNVLMLTYYWGPPNDDMEDNEVMYNDLARIDFLLDLDKSKPKISNFSYEVKYNDPSLLNVKPLLAEEGAIVNGPKLGMSMEEACKALGKKLKEGEYSDYIELDDVSLFEFCCEIVDIYVKTPKYETLRGLKVGDDIQKVESLYGKPDVGFSGDERVEYKFIYENYQGELRVNYYRIFTVYYEDGLVRAYDLYQVILD